ncbi:MAG: PIN domain-containing protein [Candidatus Desantisbacteria bacterium]
MKKEFVDIYILDTSAVLSFIEDEAGADLVEKPLRQARTNKVVILVSFITFMEVYCITLQEREKTKADERLRLMNALPVLRIDSTESVGILASHLKANHRLSVADAWIAALAKERDAILVHKDPEFEQVEAEINVLKLPYKISTP